MSENTWSCRILENPVFAGRTIGAPPRIHRWCSQSLPSKSTFPVDSATGSFRVKPSPRKSPGRGAFTLIELLVVIAILGLLAALIVPAISKALASARLTKSISNVRQIHMGFMLYVEDHNGVFPSSDFGDPDWWMAPHAGVPEYLYPGRDLTYDKRGTVFQSPNVESDGTYQSGAGRTISYGLNGSLIAGMPSRRYLLFDQPQTILLLADASFSHDLWGRMNYRNDGRAVCLFLSGQVLALTQEDVAEFHQRLFWEGRR